MKRHTMIITVIFSFLLISARPVSSIYAVSDTVKVRAPAQIPSMANLTDILNTLPEGFHDAAEGTQNQFSCPAEGWATDPDDQSIALNVRILSDGVEVAHTVASAFREDLADTGICPNGLCSFSVNLWGLISPNTDHLITVQAQDAQTGEWVNLHNTPKTLNCFEQNTLPLGYHDGLEGFQNQFFCRADGWVFDSDDQNADLNVRILADGAEVAQTVADAFRQDLYDGTVCADGTCSFSVNLAGLITPGTDHSITVQAQDAQSGEWVDLNNTPKTLNCLDSGGQPIVWDGFGNPNNFAVEALEVFKGRLYAEVTNFEEGTTLWRSTSGEKWTQVTPPGFDDAYGANNVIVFDLLSFKGQLYAGTGSWLGSPSAGQIWRSSNGTDWRLVAAGGLGNPNNNGYVTFASFKGMLYAATVNQNEGAELWRSSTGNEGSWERVAAQAFGSGSNYYVITSLTAFKGKLYASVEGSTGSGTQVWHSSNGTAWTLVTENGFGDTNNNQTGGSVVYRGQLYVTARNAVTGAQLWRSSNGTAWDQVVGDGFGDVNNIKIEALSTYAGSLYAAANNPMTGVELWRSTDGKNWTQINADGFGDPNIFISLWSHSMVTFRGNFLVGSSGPFGGAIWEIQR